MPSRVREHYHSINLATDISQINGFVANAEQIYDSMAQDKKVLNGVIRFILASDIGKAMVREYRQSPSIGSSTAVLGTLSTS